MEIIPFKKVGDLNFNAGREEVRKILGSNFTIFRKGPFATNTTDAYSELGLHLYYSEQNELKLVELFSPATPTFEGINLLRGSIDSKIKALWKFDANPETDGVSYTFHKIGISLYNESEKNEVEAVSAFAKDYYSS